ncbi:MAG: helix-turn-helix domain-containing protein [Rhizobiales bacterium]|nr:helix-turn-helix domain-containing protein [Hyphomicrobiales bacterium]
MAELLYLTPEEVTERFRGAISTGTLANWRAMRIGPAFVKIGKSVVYPVAELNEWANQNTVRCRATNRLIGKEHEQA